MSLNTFTVHSYESRRCREGKHGSGKLASCCRCRIGRSGNSEGNNDPEARSSNNRDGKIRLMAIRRLRCDAQSLPCRLCLTAQTIANCRDPTSHSVVYRRSASRMPCHTPYRSSIAIECDQLMFSPKKISHLVSNVPLNVTALILDGGIPVVCTTASRSRFRVEVSEQQDPNPASICRLWGKGPQAQGSRRRSEEGLFFSTHTPTPLSTWVARRDDLGKDGGHFSCCFM